MTNSGFFNLRAAIVAQAVKDYRAALMAGNGGAIRHLQNFFLSDWGQSLSGDNGDNIIRKVRAEVAEIKKGKKNGVRQGNKPSPRY